MTILQSLESEEAILGAMMMDPAARQDASEAGLLQDHFGNVANGKVYSAILECEAPDAMIVCKVLTGRGQLKDAGGKVRVFKLFGAAPNVANARAYADDIIHLYVKRCIALSAETMKEGAYDLTLHPNDAVAAAERLLGEAAKAAGGKYESGDTFTNEQSIEGWEQQYARRQDPSLQSDGIPYGIKYLDEAVGSQYPGDTFVWSGWTKDGKSWMLLDITEQACKAGHRAALFSLEMNDTSVTERLVAMGGHSLYKLEHGAIPHTMLHKRLDELAPLDRTTIQGRTTVSRIRAHVRQAKLEGKPYRIVVLDHLGILRPDKGFRGGKREFVEEAVAELKSIAEEYKLTLHIVAQLSRPQKDLDKSPRWKRPPIETDLKDASGIEQIATAVIFVYRERDEQTGRHFDNGNSLLLVPIHRRKPQGSPTLMVFNGDTGNPTTAYRFTERQGWNPPERSADEKQEEKRVAGLFKETFGKVQPIAGVGHDGIS